MSSAAASGVSFRIHALGHPRLEVLECGSVTKVIGPGKPLALVTYLAAAARKTESRDVLCDLLWGDKTPELARRQVRQALWLVKTEIHPDLLSTTGSNVSIAAPLTLDSVDFLAAIESNDLTLALDLYAGDFFSEYAAPGAGRFEEWASLERTRLRARFIHAAECAGKLALDSGKFAEAISIATRMRSIEPHAQSAWRLLLEARTASGDSIGALADAEQFEEWLRLEEWDPEPASIAAIRSAHRTGKSSPDNRAANDLIAELVGREKEFAALSKEWDDLQSDGARIVQVVGESGVGKTRLVSDFITRIRASRGKARYVRANYGEREIPFSFAAAIAADLVGLSGAKGISHGSAATLLALNPSLTSTFPVASSDGTRLTALTSGLALLDLLGAVSDEKPVAFILDDLHWADNESREALSLMIARLASERVLLVATYRPHYTGAFPKVQSRTLRLEPLDELSVRALVSSLARLPDDAWSDDFAKLLCESSKGSPLRVLETLRYCLDFSLLHRESDYWRCNDFALLADAFRERTSLRRRLRAFPPAHFAVLRAIAVAGVPLPRPILAKAAGIPAVEIERVISDLEVAGLVSRDQETVDVCHDSIVEEIIGSSAADSLDRVHLRLGATMAANVAEQWQSKSVQHLARAGAWTAAANQIARVLRDSRTRDAVNSGMRLLLGPASSAESMTKVRRELPFRLRFPEWRRTTLLAAVPFIVLGTAFVVKSTKTLPTLGPTTLVTIHNLSGGRKEIKEFALDREHWDPASTLRTVSTRTVSWPGIEPIRHLTPRPGCLCWAANIVYPDSGEGDIALISIDGFRQRLTAERGADLPMSFSPDGKRLLFLTTRWSKVGWSDIGVLDLTTGHVTRLTFDSQKHSGPSWSPDGTRILFGRSNDDALSNEICVMDVDGASQRCTGRGQWMQSGTHGWTSDHNAIVSFVKPDSASTSFRLLDLRSWDFRQSNLPDRATVVSDPTGRWMIIGDPGQNGFAKISPAESFNAAIVLDSMNDEMMFASPRFSDVYVDSLAIESGGPVELNVPHMLRAIAWNRSHVRMMSPVIRWRSLTPEIAEIDSLGVLTPHREGAAVVEVSAGGWRIAVDTIQVRSTKATQLLDEKWDADALARWTPFGDPKPLFQEYESSRVLNNNGDGNFFSGVYLKKSLDTSRGIALDIALSTPITRNQWQIIEVILGDVRVQTRSGWDHRTGYLPLGSETGCAFAYPAGEGEGATSRFRWYESMKEAFRDPSFRLDDGRWYRLRVQLLPDRRCGIAINGHAMAINAPVQPRLTRATPVIQGSNVGSRILVGRLSLFEGVPDDVDWSMLETNDGFEWLRTAKDRRH